MFKTMSYGKSYAMDTEAMMRTMATEMRQLYGGLTNLQKRDYEVLAKAISATADPIRNALSTDGGATTRQIVEIVAAQIGLALAAENSSFDSFMFVEAIEKGIK